MINEELLILRLKEKDTRALSTLYDNYSGALYGVIIRMCREEGLAQDLLQETFVKIWEKIDFYDPEKGKFYTWAYRIARNTTLNSLRTKKDLIQSQDLSVYTNTALDEEDTPDIFKLKGSLAKLEDHHRKAIELVYYSGLTHREAHEEMNVPLGTFKSYIQQALKKLRANYQFILPMSWLLIEWML